MDQSDDPITPQAGHLNGTSVVGTTDSTVETGADTPITEAATPDHADPVGLRPGFLSELAVAMRATAERERENIGNRVAEDASGHIDKVRARAAIETEELRRLAEEDVQHIEEWSAAEMDRIRGEADQKIGYRRASLDDYLKQHDAIIETEIEGVDAAVRDYNTTLDGFFAELASSDDPSAIVARAETLPAPPDLDQVRAQARASAVAMFVESDVEETPVETTAVSDDHTGSDEGGAADAFATAADAPVVDAEAVTAEAVTAEAVTAEAVTAEAVSVEAMSVEDEPTTEAIVGESDSEASSSVDPVPVMDPAATSETSWPETEPGSEPAEVSPTVDHTSAAVRLLRSVAPWTAPTHAGSDRGSDSD